MAKMTARGAHKVIGYVFDATDSDARERGERCEITYALRSDGAILRKIDFVYPASQWSGRYRQSGGYSIVGRLRDRDSMTVTEKTEAFERFVNRKLLPRYGQPVRKARS